MNPGAAWQWAAGLSSLGFYIFLSVWVAAIYWSRTKERLAIQETLQKLAQSGTSLTPEAIDALRRPKPRRTAEQIDARVRKLRYWGLFLVGLGTIISLYGLRYSDSPIRDLRDMSGGAIVLFVIPGLFLLAHSVISSLVAKSGHD
jgi:hypothetical protein